MDWPQNHAVILLRGLICCVSHFITARLLPVPGLGGLEVICLRYVIDHLSISVHYVVDD